MTSPLKTKFQTPQARGCESAQIHSKILPCTWHDNPTHRRQERANGVQREARDERTIASDFFECQGGDSTVKPYHRRASIQVSLAQEAHSLSHRIHDCFLYRACREVFQHQPCCLAFDKPRGKEERHQESTGIPNHRRRNICNRCCPKRPSEFKIEMLAKHMAF